MTAPSLTLLLLGLVTLTTAHVRLYYEPARMAIRYVIWHSYDFPICFSQASLHNTHLSTQTPLPHRGRVASLRTVPSFAHTHTPLSTSHLPSRSPPTTSNANGATSDGSMSTSGACGGRNTWGSNGVSKVRNGASVALRINYNGGHKSPANAFSMAFACGKPGDQKLVSAKRLPASACAATPSYPTHSPTGNTVAAGYTINCTLPVQDLALADGGKCTVSLLDQRSWGGCVDIELQSTTPPVPPKPKVVDHTGTYPFGAANNIVCPSNACKLGGSFKITQTDLLALSIDAAFTASGACAAKPDIAIMAQTLTLTRPDTQSTQFKGTLTMKGQVVQFTAVDKFIQWSNLDPDTPLICDG